MGIMTTPKELADQHWTWVEGLLDSLPGDGLFGIATMEYLYTTAMIHGYKHGYEGAMREKGGAT